MTDRVDPIPERIDRELVIPASLVELWRVLTGDGWLAEHVELDLTPGGEARFVTGERSRTGWVEEACPPEANGGAHLVFWWSADGEPASRVEIRLEAEDEGTTRLSLTESRPLELLDVVGIPLPGAGGWTHGPSLLVAA